MNKLRYKQIKKHDLLIFIIELLYVVSTIFVWNHLIKMDNVSTPIKCYLTFAIYFSIDDELSDIIKFCSNIYKWFISKYL